MDQIRCAQVAAVCECSAMELTSPLCHVERKSLIPLSHYPSRAQDTTRSDIFWTVVIPVSSLFHIRCGSNFKRSYTMHKLSKKLFTLCRLKLAAKLRLVASSLRSDNVRWRFKNPVNQSLPARPFLHQTLGHGTFNFFCKFESEHSNFSGRKAVIHLRRFQHICVISASSCDAVKIWFMCFRSISGAFPLVVAMLCAAHWILERQYESICHFGWPK